MSFYVVGNVLLDRRDLVLGAVMADSTGGTRVRAQMYPRRGEERPPRPTRAMRRQWWESSCLRKKGIGSKRGELPSPPNDRNSHIFPAASGDRGPPAHCPAYLPALTDTLVARAKGIVVRRPCSRDQEPLGAPGAVVDTPRIIWGHHPGRGRTRSRLSAQNRKEEGSVRAVEMPLLMGESRSSFSGRAHR